MKIERMWMVAISSLISCAMPVAPRETVAGAQGVSPVQAGVLRLQLGGYRITNAAAMQLEPPVFVNLEPELAVRVARGEGAGTLELGVAPIRANGMWRLRSVACDPAAPAPAPRACYRGTIQAPLAVGGLADEAILEVVVSVGANADRARVEVRQWASRSPASFDDDPRTTVGSYGRGTIELEPAPVECACPTSITNGDPANTPNNFCHLDAWTPGCPMTFAGGYCDSDGNGIFEDETSESAGIEADWTRGFHEADAAGCPPPPPDPRELCCAEVAARPSENDNFCFASDGCGASYCPASASSPDGRNWDLGWYRFQCWCVDGHAGVSDDVCASL